MCDENEMVVHHYKADLPGGAGRTLLCPSLPEQPDSSTRSYDGAMIDLAYIAGVLHGDGWCTEHTIGLGAKDKDFVLTFLSALIRITGRSIRIRPHARKYWIVRTCNRTGRFSWIKGYEPRNDLERAAWVRGMFDSEGNASCVKVKQYHNSFIRRVAFYSTSVSTLTKTSNHLSTFGIPTSMAATKNSEGHLGDKTVYELRVLCSRHNFGLFSASIGSSIERKRITIDKIINTYSTDLSKSMRNAQKQGAAAKVRKTALRLPSVLSGIRMLIEQGIKPTMRHCQHIPGYYGQRGHYTHRALVSMSQEVGRVAA